MIDSVFAYSLTCCTLITTVISNTLQASILMRCKFAKFLLQPVLHCGPKEEFVEDRSEHPGEDKCNFFILCLSAFHISFVAQKACCLSRSLLISCRISLTFFWRGSFQMFTCSMNSTRLPFSSAHHPNLRGLLTP